MSTTYVSVHIEDTTQIVAAATASRVEVKVRRPDAHQIWMTGSAETMTRLRDALLSVLPLGRGGVVSLLERIIAEGNRGPYTPGNYRSGPNWITCADGFKVSVIAGNGAYCTPRPSFGRTPYPGEVEQDYAGPYTHVEVGFPSQRPEPWDGEVGWASYAEDAETHETVYPQVPVEMVRALVAAHGGES